MKSLSRRPDASCLPPWLLLLASRHSTRQGTVPADAFPTRPAAAIPHTLRQTLRHASAASLSDYLSQWLSTRCRVLHSASWPTVGNAAFGVAGLETNVPVTAETRFQIGSPAGGLWSMTRDLLRYARFHLGDDTVPGGTVGGMPKKADERRFRRGGDRKNT
jgi:CubicO group peptidase (beta-lactamase class C family)